VRPSARGISRQQPNRHRSPPEMFSARGGSRSGAHNPLVGGSSPTWLTTTSIDASLVTESRCPWAQSLRTKRRSILLALSGLY
jgi:hypothetical protein